MAAKFRISEADKMNPYMSCIGLPRPLDQTAHNLLRHDKFWQAQKEEQYYFHENQKVLTMLHNWHCCLHCNLQEVAILNCFWVSKDHTHFKQALKIIKTV